MSSNVERSRDDGDVVISARVAAALALVLVTAGCAPGGVAALTAQDAPAAAALSTRGVVTKVTDGDTVHVKVGSQNLDVRVIGEDSPEVVKPGVPVQCWGPQASAEAHRVLDGQTVTLVADPSQAKVDRYGRSLFYVRLLSGEDLSMHMVAGGWSRAYKVSGPVPQEWTQLVAAENQAKAAQRGLWAPRPQGCGGGV